MALMKPVAAGLVASLSLSYLMSDQEGLVRNIFAVTMIEVGQHRIWWSWPIFAIVTIFGWVVQKITAN